MTPAKRAFDLALAVPLALVALPICLLIAVAIRLLDGGPVLFRSERMHSPQRAFVMLKFRTMTPDARDAGVTGGDKRARITRLGRLLRRSHLDEIPQLWNVLRGDMSLVGPRPPLRRYVERCPDLYARVLRARPGVTGLATLLCAPREARLLAGTDSPAATEEVYLRACLPIKARLDLIYLARRGPWLDAAILWRTLYRRRGGPGRLPRRAVFNARRRPSTRSAARPARRSVPAGSR